MRSRRPGRSVTSIVPFGEEADVPGVIEPGDDRRDPELRWNARRGERGEQQNDAEQARGAAHGPRRAVGSTLSAVAPLTASNSSKATVRTSSMSRLFVSFPAARCSWMSRSSTVAARLLSAVLCVLIHVLRMSSRCSSQVADARQLSSVASKPSTSWKNGSRSAR